MYFETIFDGRPVSPEEILESRSTRVQLQKLLLDGSCTCLISFTLNIPGAMKQFSLARAAFSEGCAALGRAFPDGFLSQQIRDLATGSEAFFTLRLAPETVKARTVEIEECHPLGRLFDMDVLSKDGCSLNRAAIGKGPRTCFLCGQNAKICARSRAHSPELLRFHLAQMLDGYFRESWAQKYTFCVTRALLHEVSTTPKPGLVDRNNSGSHTDMDFSTFMDSSAALSPWLHELFCVGWDSCDLPADQLFDKLRFVGKYAEAAMFTATKGVNTHKGLLFSLGILCGAAGALQAKTPEPLPLSALLTLCRQMGGYALKDFCTADQSAPTGGETAYRSHRITGARGELSQGFPTVFNAGLPALRQGLQRGLSLNDASALTLLSLLGCTEDTNMIHRGGIDLAVRRRLDAQALCQQIDKTAPLAALHALDDAYRSENLSPGGCADLLCLTLAFHFALSEGLITEELSK